jgi:hypothetical protein
LKNWKATPDIHLKSYIPSLAILETMSKETQQTEAAQPEALQAEQQSKPQQQTYKATKEEFAQAIEILNDEGGFNLVSTTVEGAENMAPGALKQLFLTDGDNKAERTALKERLKSWVDLLSQVDNVGDMIETAQDIHQRSGTLLNSNLKKVLETTRSLEENYRATASFYVNAGGDSQVKNITIMNAPMERVTDLDSRQFISTVAKEFKEKYDRLDLMNNYGMLVIPGFMGTKEAIDEWGRVAHEHKVMMVTDFRNLESTDQVMRVFERAKLAGADDFRANIMMTCNWLVGREQYTEAGESEPLYIPASTALAGKMYAGNMAQVSAGVQHGVLRGISGTRFTVFASDMAKLGEMGLIPMATEYNQVQAMSKTTLFNGTNLGLQTYSVVRTFDWLTKCLMDYLNRKVFVNIKVNEVMGIQNEITRFFDKCVREYKFLERVGRVEVTPHPVERDRVNVYIHATPFFPARNFVLHLDGKDGENKSYKSDVK